MKIRIGHGFDVHRLAKRGEATERSEATERGEAGEKLPLRLGGVTVPHTKGCVAHSDGDVVIHALCDALLGAAALGDIGLHFPDTDGEFRGIDSRELLRRTVEIVKKAGWEVGNVDCTVMLQTPKIRPYIDAMRGELAAAMGVDRGAVSVKATTTERLGFVGREEGVAAEAVVLLI
jgi:2-C-methyl-D-erythritol 2,4-cyclodiphosphate synthase